MVAVDPVGSILAQPDTLNDHKRLEGYQVEGIGYDFVPSVLDYSVVDEWVKVDDPEAFAMARNMIRHEGLLVGGSSGSCVAGAYKYIKDNEEALRGKRVVILCADSIRNYMSKFLDDKWMKSYGFKIESEAEPLNTAVDILKDGNNASSNLSPSSVLRARACSKRLKELDQAQKENSVDVNAYPRLRANILKQFGFAEISEGSKQE